MKIDADINQQPVRFIEDGFINRIVSAVCSGIFLLYFCSCAHLFISGSSDSEVEETAAVEALFLWFYHDGLPAYHRGHTNYVEEVVFLAKGTPGWDGNITPLPNQFGSAPVVWLSKLSKYGIKIKDVKDAVYSKELRFVVDRESGKPGEIFEVEKITQISPEEMRIDAQRYSGPMNATGACYILRRKNGVWHVEKSENDWIQ